MGIKSPFRHGAVLTFASFLCSCTSGPTHSPVDIPDTQVVTGDISVTGSIDVVDSHADVRLQFTNRSEQPATIAIHGGCPVTLAFLAEDSQATSTGIYDNQACPDIRSYLTIGPHEVKVLDARLVKQKDAPDPRSGAWVATVHFSTIPEIQITLRSQK